MQEAVRRGRNHPADLETLCDFQCHGVVVIVKGYGCVADTAKRCDAQEKRTGMKMIDWW